ncbi:MAG: hypothetical protein AB7S26_29295 [Sandaracinaceae bacterium]
MELFDVAPYVNAPRFTGLSGVFLSRALLQAAPSSPTPRVRMALVAVRDSAEQLRRVVRERMRTSPRNLRPLDAQLDSGWVGLRETLEAKSRLEGTPIAARAATLLSSLFPDGTAFVRADYREQWAASQIHLERIDEENLADEIAALAGADYLPFIQRAHDAFGEAMGLGEEIPEVADSNALARAIADVAGAVADYGRILAGEVDRADPASVSAFRRAMAPIDAQRRASKRSARNEEPIEDIEDSGDGIGDDATEEDAHLDEPMPVVGTDAA